MPDIVMKYKENEYGGIDVVELNYKADAVYTNGDLEDEFGSVQEYLDSRFVKKFLYDSVLECAQAMEEKNAKSK